MILALTMRTYNTVIVLAARTAYGTAKMAFT